MNGQYPSTLLEKAVNEFAKLPGIGRKTAMRLVLHLLRQDTAAGEGFGNAIGSVEDGGEIWQGGYSVSITI